MSNAKYSRKHCAHQFSKERHRVVHLGDICVFGSGTGFPDRFQGHPSGDYPFIKVSDFEIRGNEREILYANNWVSRETLSVIRAKLHKPGSIVFAKVGAAMRLNRRRILTRPTAIDNNLMSATARPGKVTPEYLLLILSHIDMGAWAQETSVPSVNQRTLESIEVGLPSLPEQRLITAVLSSWNDSLERLSRQIERKEQLLASIRERLIQGAHRLGGRNSPWPMTALSEVTQQLTGRNGDRYGRDLVMGVTKAEGIVPMREHVVAENISRYLVLPPNGFAYNPMRINIGSIAMSEHEGDVIVSPDYVVFACKEDRLHPRFLNHLRRTKAWADFMTIAGNGSVRVRIYYASLAEFEFHLPPLDEQRAIVEVLDDAEREITVLEAERAALARQRDALATELLTGRLRVPQAEAAS